MLTFTDLSAGYGKLVVLHNISLSVPPAQLSTILGPNGSGKSTLMRSIFGLAQVSGGSIQLDAVNLIGVPTEHIGEYGIAYVPQQSNVFTTMTIRENLLLALRKSPKNEASRALDAVYGLFPILSGRQSQRAGRLSGGERQMLAIAIAWLSRPRVMLLDEPTAGLSPLLVTEVLRTLKEFAAQGMTVVMVEQNARSALQWCDYVYVLREGQLAFQGTAEACRADEELLKSYLGVNVAKGVWTTSQ